jgi:ribosomal protein S18 acetylase RimI-like enzyme
MRFFFSNMIKFKPVKTAEDPALVFVKELYHTAFPETERRKWEDLLGLLEKSTDMQMEVIFSNAAPVAFVTSWQFNEWCFIEHLAVTSEQRGKQIGKQIMQQMLMRGKVLLEVEPPETEDASRRIGFYQRLGLFVLPFEYLQPSYHEADKTYQMNLMTDSKEQEEGYYTEVIAAVKKHVYGRPNKND